MRPDPNPPLTIPTERLAAALTDGRPSFGEWLRGRQIDPDLELALRVRYLPAVLAALLLAGCAVGAPAALAAAVSVDLVADAGAPDAPPPVDSPPPPPPPVDAPPPPPPMPFTATLYDCSSEYSDPTRQGWEWHGGTLNVYPGGVSLFATPAAPGASMARFPIARPSAIFTINFSWQGTDSPDATFTVGGFVPGATVVVHQNGWSWYDGTGWTPITGTPAGPLVIATDGAGNASATLGGVTIRRSDACNTCEAQASIGVNAPAGASVGYVNVLVSSVTEFEPVGGVKL